MSNGPEKAGVITPYPLAMVVCDYIWNDPYTGKKTLIGTFSAIEGPSFPLVHPNMGVHISLTDGRGKMPVKLLLVDAEEERDPIYVQEGEVEFDDPRAIVEITFQVAGLQFPEPGEYRLQLFANHEFVLERRLLVLGPPLEEKIK